MTISWSFYGSGVLIFRKKHSRGGNEFCIRGKGDCPSIDTKILNLDSPHKSFNATTGAIGRRQLWHIAAAYGAYKLLDASWRTGRHGEMGT